MVPRAGIEPARPLFTKRRIFLPSTALAAVHNARLESGMRLDLGNHFMTTLGPRRPLSTPSQKGLARRYLAQKCWGFADFDGIHAESFQFGCSIF
jgi:hypothetical protein